MLFNCTLSVDSIFEMCVCREYFDETAHISVIGWVEGRRINILTFIPFPVWFLTFNINFYHSSLLPFFVSLKSFIIHLTIFTTFSSPIFTPAQCFSSFLVIFFAFRSLDLCSSVSSRDSYILYITAVHCAIFFPPRTARALCESIERSTFFFNTYHHISPVKCNKNLLLFAVFFFFLTFFNSFLRFFFRFSFVV